MGRFQYSFNLRVFLNGKSVFKITLYDFAGKVRGRVGEIVYKNDMFEGDTTRCSIDVGRKFDVFKIYVKVASDMSITGMVTFGNCKYKPSLVTVPNILTFHKVEGDVIFAVTTEEKVEP